MLAANAVLPGASRALAAVRDPHGRQEQGCAEAETPGGEVEIYSLADWGQAAGDPSVSARAYMKLL